MNPISRQAKTLYLFAFLLLIAAIAYYAYSFWNSGQQSGGNAPGNGGAQNNSILKNATPLSSKASVPLNRNTPPPTNFNNPLPTNTNGKQTQVVVPPNISALSQEEKIKLLDSLRNGN